MMPEFDDLTDDEVKKILRQLEDFERGNWALCRRKSLYSMYMPQHNDTSYFCGIHSAEFKDSELRVYDGPETCTMVVID